MRLHTLRWMPGLLTALVLLAAGTADAHALDDLYQCVFSGPLDNCG